MKNILLISATSQTGGGPKHLLDLLHGIDRTKYNPMVIAPNDGAFFAKFSEEATTYELNLRRDILNNVLKIKRIIRANDISIVHSHGRLAGIYSRLVKTPSIQVIHTFHGIYYENRSKGSQILINLMDKLSRLRTDAYIAVSKAEGEEAIRLGFAKKGQLHVIYNGVNTRDFETPIDKNEYRRSIGLNVSDFVIGYVSRFSDFKGHIDLVRAFEIVQKSIPRAKLLLVGDGSTMDMVKKEVKQWGFEDKVVFLGQRNDVPQLLKCMDVFVSPSHKEGMPYNLIEAMAAGVPLVATNVTGNSEIVLDGVNGILCMPGNSKELSEAIVKMANMEDNGNCFIRNSKEILNEKFLLDKMIEKTMNVYGRK